MILRDRYDNLLLAIDATAKNSKAHKPYRILEVGTYNGGRAEIMIKRAKRAGRTNVHYIGFDLFELCTPAIVLAEKSKSKLPPSEEAVRRRLAPLQANVELWKGLTTDTLPDFFRGMDTVKAPYFLDLLYIDGGHSVPTIENDWNYCSNLIGPKTICLLDDYYPDRTDFGCQLLFNRLQDQSLSKHWKAELLEPIDTYESSKTTVQFVKVTRA